MKNTLKTIISIILVGIFTFAAVIPALAGESDGWHENNDGWYYTVDGAKQRNKLMDDSGGTCYLDDYGYVLYCDWFTLYDENYNYLFQGYAGVDGHIYKNRWALLDGYWYYFKANGALTEGEWVKDSKGWCFLNYGGEMLTACSVEDSKGWCLLDESGHWVTKPGWNKVSYQDGLVTRTDWYYVEKNGYLRTDAWMKDSVGWCYLDNYGTVATCVSVEDSKGFCLVDESGHWVTKPGWQSVTVKFADGTACDKWFYVENSGYLRTNAWAKDSKGWCYLDGGGWLGSRELVKDGTGYCFIGDDGYWAKNAGIYYFFEYVDIESSLKRYCLVGSDGYVKVSENTAFWIPDVTTYDISTHIISGGFFNTDSRGVLSSRIGYAVHKEIEPDEYISYKLHYRIYDENPSLFK